MSKQLLLNYFLKRKTKESVVGTFKKILYRILSINFWEKKYFIRHFRENQQRTFVMFSRFRPKSGWGWGKGGESVKKGKFGTKTFFQIIMNEILESRKNDIC